MKPSTKSLILAPLIVGLSTFSTLAKDQENKFSIKNSPKYTISKISRRQFDNGLGINFKSGKPTIAGTGKHHCEAGFQFAPQNNGLTKKELNKHARSWTRKRQIRRIISGFFDVSNMKTVTLQGYRGHELSIKPRLGPNHENVRGMMVMIETPQGRMTQVCMTLKSEYRKALRDFRTVTKNITMPE